MKRKCMMATVVLILMMALMEGCVSSKKAEVLSTENRTEESEISVSGKISKLGEMQFNMKADNKVVKENGTIENKGNGHKLTVLYDEETTFYIRTIYDDGNYEDNDATAGDMAKDMMVEITGYYEGKKFHAEQVQMMKFE
ncbi:MAG: hypothetical protein K2L82_17860 [Lachnospiraceae bacterium]|nr:hypothetical protein [Lachnospiraceae bacterium]